MTKIHHRRKASALALTLIIACSSQYLGVRADTIIASNAQIPTIDEQNANGRLPVLLQRTESAGYKFSVPAKPGIPGTLVAIDGIALRGASEDQIEKLLRGRVGTTAVVSVMEFGGVVREVQLTREPISKIGRAAPKDLTEALDEIERGQPDAGDRGNRWEEQNLDLVARAVCQRAMDAAQELRGDNSSIVGDKAAEGLLINYMLGNLPTGDAFAQSLAEKPHISLSFNRVDSKPAKIIADLRATDRFEAADNLCKTWLDSMHSGSDLSGSAVSNEKQLSLLYAEGLCKEQKHAEALSLVQTLYDPKAGIRQAFWTVQDLTRIATVLEQCGASDKAEACFEDLINPQQNKWQQQQTVVNIEQAREHGYLAYRLAMLQERANKFEDAIKTLREAIAIYASKTRPDERLTSEKICLFFPRESDLEIQLAELCLKSKDYAGARSSAESAIEHISHAVGPRHSDLQKPFKVLARIAMAQNQRSEAHAIWHAVEGLPRGPSWIRMETLEQRFAPLVHVYQTADVTQAAGYTNELTRSYRRADPDYHFQREPINQFCALIQIARYFSDLSLIDRSNAILTCLKEYSPSRELNPVASAFAQIELAINAERQKSPNALWNQALANPLLKRRNILVKDAITDEASSKLQAAADTEETFRALAVIYEAAGEHSRADLLLNHAVKQQAIVDSLAKADANADKSAISRDQVILLLDQAQLCAQRGKSDEAQMLGESAVRLCANTLPGNGDEGQRFYELYRSKVVSIAKALKKRNVSNSVIETFLKLVNSKLSDGASSGIKRDGVSYVSTSFSGYDSLINEYLAELTYEDKNFEETQHYVGQAIAESGNSVSYTLWLLGAEIANQCKDYETAAHRYSEAEQRLGFFPEVAYKRQSSLSCLRKAWELIAQDAAFDKTEAANIGLRLGLALENKDGQQALAVFDRVDQLIPTSDPGKLRLAQRISNLKSSIAVQEARSAHSVPQAVTLGKLTPEQIHAQAVSNVTSRIKGFNQKIANEEKYGPPPAYTDWLNLAAAEEEAELPTDAIAHAKRAIQEYKRPSNSSEFPSCFISSTFAVTLSKQGRRSESEQLLSDGLRVMQNAFGEKSAAAAIQLGQIAEYYFDEERMEDGEKALDQMLSFNRRVLDVRSVYGSRGLQIGQYPCGSAIQNIYDYAEALRNKGKAPVAMQILQKILNSERRVLVLDDSRIAQTLVAIAQTELALDRKEDAKRHFVELANIYKLYYGYVPMGLQNQALLNDLWKKVSGTSETPIEVRDLGRVYPSLLRAVGDNAEAEQIERDKATPPNYLNPCRWQWLQGQNNHADPEEQIQKLKHEYEAACAEAPYSGRAAGALDAMMRIAMQEQDWNALAYAADARCGIYERIPDIDAGISYGCDRMDFYSRAARAYIHLNKIGEAQQWLDRAVKMLPEMNCAEYITLATLELRCNNPALATTFAALGDKQFTEQYAAVYPAEAANVWRLLGQPDRAATILDRARQLRAQEKEREQRAKSSPFNTVPTGI